MVELTRFREGWACAMEVNMKSVAQVSLVAVFLGLGITAVAAQPSLPQPANMKASSENVLLADYKKHHHNKWVYSDKYGPRYRHRRHGYDHYYEGWWYRRPYWEPGISIHLGM
jgi:hypothetical protein